MIWLTQWLCPDRHCSIALAWDDAVETAEEVVAKGESLYQSGIFNPWCGICGHVGLHVEHGETRFRSMEEAMTPLLEAQQANTLTRHTIGENAPLGSLHERRN